jgi:hypothetical protein
MAKHGGEARRRSLLFERRTASEIARSQSRER